MPNVVRLQRSIGVPLSDGTPQLHPNHVNLPEYDRSALTPSVVHIGLGNFHRAHQAVYFDDLANSGISRQWGITGVNLRQGRTKAVLAAQNGLYTVVQRGHGEDTARVVGSLRGWLYAGEDTAAVLSALTDEQTRVVTLTITGNAYCTDERMDVAAEPQPRNDFDSTWDYLAEALDRRRRNGIAPFTVLSCDNVPDNGHAARTALVSVASRRDPSLGRWINRNVAFPSTMVDRITPETKSADTAFVEQKFGIADKCPVLAEPFRQWIIEDEFCDQRPPLDEVGVEFVTDVRPHKLVKTRLLNGIHSAMAYLALLAGYERSDEAMRDPGIGRYVEQLMRNEIVPLLPAVPGLDTDHYCTTVVNRLGNPRISDPLTRLARRGSIKMPSYLLPSLHEAIAAGRPHNLLMLAVAGWARYLRGTDLEGRSIDIQDPQRDLLRASAKIGKNNPDPLLRNHDIFGNLRSVPGFANRLQQMIQTIDTLGVSAALNRHTTSDLRKLVGQ